MTDMGDAATLLFLFPAPCPIGKEKMVLLVCGYSAAIVAPPVMVDALLCSFAILTTLRLNKGI